MSGPSRSGRLSGRLQVQDVSAKGARGRESYFEKKFETTSRLD